ncbi:glycosyl transferase [Mycobacterium sp. ACS1612]|uniref:glycosyl transferase n=1 Tax=Mycobacterium sp. ACS1612 TaxID=1834117 RepID=UPI001E5F571A|nr:glycosyl transferase [Mycobacterium sp. ACS1612]
MNASIPVLGILLILTATLRLINLTRSPARIDDEGTYMAQAYAVAKWGELAHYTYWYDHPPAGWLQLALWTAISGPDFGGNAVAAGRCLMAVVAVITAALLWTLARRLEMSRWATAAAVGIFALSPLAISLSRTVYLDNLATAWVLGALVLLCSSRYRLSAMFSAATCFGIAVLTKETMLLLLPTFAWLVWTRAAPVTRRYALAVFAAVFGVVVSTYLLMAVLRGELVPGPGHVSLWDGIKFQLWERAPGGALDDPGSLKRHTVDEWLKLDPALPFLAVPITLAGLFVKRLRPFAVGLVILIATILRPGYLPVPFIVSVLPLTALVAAGTGEVVLRHLRRPAAARSIMLRRLRIPALAVGTLVVSIAVSLWLPTYHGLLDSDEDASMRRAQHWIEENVPKADRLIIDGAFWMDLVRNGRDRRNVVWAYKVDTDKQVQGWAPHGWADYDWVVSTASLRANVPPTGVLVEAIAHSHPAVTFGLGGTRVEVLRVDNGKPSSKPPSPAAPAFGGQLAARLAGGTDPEVLAALQSRMVDQRVLATLAVIAATQPVRVEKLSSIQGEDDTGTPIRDVTLGGPRDRLQGVAAFLERQVGPFTVQSVASNTDELQIRFPLRANDIGLGANPPSLHGGPAALRVADLRRSRQAEQLNLVRIDGTAAGSLATSEDANPSDYRSMPAGTYVVVTSRPDGGDPVICQVITLRPGVSYTLAMFSAAESGRLAAQLAPDDPAERSPDSPVRMLHAASATGSVYLALVAPGMLEPMTLVNQAGYGLITGYAGVPAGQYEAVVSANGREWREPVEFRSGEPTSLLLTDGPDGPVLRTLRDVPEAPAALDPPTLMMPATESVPGKTAAKPPAGEGSNEKRIVVVLCAVTIMVAAALMARARPTRRPAGGGQVVRRARPADNNVRQPRTPVRAPVPPRWPRRPNDVARRAATGARRHGGAMVRGAQALDETVRLRMDVPNTAPLPRASVKPSGRRGST